jgi:hypothetical protein
VAVRLQRKQLAASDRPCVYPITQHTWLDDEKVGEGGRFLSFRNGGTGIAQNVHGELWWHAEDGHALLVGQTLGPGDHFRVWLRDERRVTRWYGAEGYVVYEDVQGVEWQSRFRYEHDGKLVWARLREWKCSSELDDPAEAFPRQVGPTRSCPISRSQGRRCMSSAACRPSRGLPSGYGAPGRFEPPASPFDGSALSRLSYGGSVAPRTVGPPSDRKDVQIPWISRTNRR